MGEQPRRYHFRLRFGLLVAACLGVALLLLHAPSWLGLMALGLLLVGLGYLAYFEREPLGLIMAWKNSMIAVGLSQSFRRNGKDVVTYPRLVSLYYSPGRTVCHVAPLPGQLAQLEHQLPRIAAILGMSSGHLEDQRSNWRATRVVLEFRRHVALGVERVPSPPRIPEPGDQQRGAAVVTGRDGSDVVLPVAPRPVLGVPQPVYTRRELDGDRYEWGTVQRPSGAVSAHVKALGSESDCPPVLVVDADGSERPISGCPFAGLSRAAVLRVQTMSAYRLHRCGACQLVTGGQA